MFGENREIMDYTVWPTQEGKEILAEQALARIEIIGGEEYLDGYRLPPDNYEIWQPQTYRMKTTHLTEVDGVLQAHMENDTCESTLTNAYIREVNILCIAAGSSPLFIKWSEIELSGLRRQPRETVLNRVKDKLSILLFAKAS